MRTKLFYTSAILALFSGMIMAEDVVPQVKDGQPHAFDRPLHCMQEANTPAILIKEENLGAVGFNAPYYTKDAGEYDVRLILGRIVLSSAPKYKPGTLVLLSIGERVKKETPYWLVNLEGSEPKELAKDGSVIYCFGEAFYSWNGIFLLQNKQYLKGIWKQMAEEIAMNDPRPQRGEPGHFTNELLYDMGSLRDCITFQVEVNPFTKEKKDELREKIMRHIAEHPEDNDAEEYSEGFGWSPLYMAYIMNDKEMVTALLNHGAKPIPPEGRVFSPEHVLTGLTPDPHILRLITAKVREYLLPRY